MAYMRQANICVWIRSDFMVKEFQKIYSRPVSLGLLAAAVILSIGLSIFFICNYGYEIHQGDDTIYYSGIDAVKIEKNAMERIPAVLSVENLNDSIRFYHKFIETGTAKEEFDKKYPGWSSLFQDAYVPVTENNPYILDEKQNANDFYEKIMERMPEWMAGTDGTIYSESEKRRALTLAEKIKKPYINEFFGQWTILLKTSFIFFYAVILYAVFLSGQIFSYETDCGMDLVLAPCDKKKIMRTAYQKMGGVFFYLTFMVILCILIQVAVIFVCCGVSGGNNSVQTLWGFISCLYPMNLRTFFFYSYVLAWISILCIAAVSAFFNACTNNKYISIALTALLLILPSMIGNILGKNAAVQRFTFLQPVTGTNALIYGPSMRTFSLGTLVLRGGDAVMLECIILLILAFWTAPKIYWKRIHR